MALRDSAGRIAAGTRVDGDVVIEGDLLVEGHLVGSLTGPGTVTVAAGGIVEAQVHVRRLIVEGTVVGRIKASDGVELGASAQVKGDIDAPSLALEAGGRIAGKVKTGVSVETPRASSSRGRRATPYRHAAAPRATAAAAPEPAKGGPKASETTEAAPKAAPTNGDTQKEVVDLDEPASSTSDASGKAEAKAPASPENA